MLNPNAKNVSDQKCRNCGAPKIFPEQKVCAECKKPYRKPLFHPKNAIESMKSNSFDALSAYCEVIDNSLEAGSVNVRVKMEPSENNKGIHMIAFGVV